MASRVVNNGDAVRKRIRKEMQRRLRACAILVMEHAKDLINIDGTGVVAKGYTSRYRSVTRKVRKGTLIYGANPSLPGDPPHKQKGRLLASVAFAIDNLIARVGTNVKYGRFLELGTRKMAARPWLRRALLEKEAEIRAIFSAPMR